MYGRHFLVVGLTRSFFLAAQDVVAKVTVMGRRKMESVPEQHGVDLSAEETEGRLVQHVEGGQYKRLLNLANVYLMQRPGYNVVDILLDSMEFQ